VATLILNGPLKSGVIDKGLHAALRNISQAWRLERSGAYRLLRPVRKQKASWRSMSPQIVASVFLERLQTEPLLTIGIGVWQLTAFAAQPTLKSAC